MWWNYLVFSLLWLIISTSGGSMKRQDWHIWMVTASWVGICRVNVISVNKNLRIAQYSSLCQLSPPATVIYQCIIYILVAATQGPVLLFAVCTYMEKQSLPWWFYSLKQMWFNIHIAGVPRRLNQNHVVSVFWVLPKNIWRWFAIKQLQLWKNKGSN